MGEDSEKVAYIGRRERLSSADSEFWRYGFSKADIGRVEEEECQETHAHTDAGADCRLERTGYGRDCIYREVSLCLCSCAKNVQLCVF